MSKQEFQIQSVRVVTGLLRNFLESEKFPFLKCASGNRALQFLGTFREISGSFLETVRVGTFLVFSRKFPKRCASGYVPPLTVLLVLGKICQPKIVLSKLSGIC